MTDEEYIKTIPSISSEELFEELDYCGYDSYYRTIREPVVAEIKKRVYQADNLSRHILELQKKNAILKEQVNILDNCDRLGDVITEAYKDQLTKAKELLERLLITSCNSDVLNLLPNCSEVLRVRVEAEQFLNSEVEK